MQNSDTILSTARLPRNKPTRFELVIDDLAKQRLIKELELTDLRKVVLKGDIAPKGRQDWLLTAHLGATVIQPCVVTLTPVTTRVEEDFSRHYTQHIDLPEEEEIEMPANVDQEEIPQQIDLIQLIAEVLALSIPAFPRAKGAELEQAQFAPPGVDPLTDEQSHAFASLLDLRDRLKDK